MKSALAKLELEITKVVITAQRAALTLLASILFGKSIISGNPERILALRIGGLGDFLFAVPGFALLRRQFPTARIALLTTSSTKKSVRRRTQTLTNQVDKTPWCDLVKGSVVDEIIYFDRVWSVRELRKVRHAIRTFDPDVTFVLRHTSEAAVRIAKKLFYLRAIGVTSDVFGWRMRSTIGWLRRWQHLHELFEHQVLGPIRAIKEHPLVARENPIRIEFPLRTIDGGTEEIEGLLGSDVLLNRKIVAVAPGSVQMHKRWPIEKFCALCAAITARYNILVVVVGTGTEGGLGSQIADRIGAPVVNAIGRTSVAGLSELLKRCSLLVGNDGGAMHLGAALGCPTVSIMSGIEYPGSVEPWGFESLAVRHTVPCAPCYSFEYCPKKHNKCLMDLPMEMVLSRCQEVLDGTTPLRSPQGNAPKSSS